MALVNLYTCDGCDHIWTTSKQTGRFLMHITRPPEPKAPEKK